MLASAAAVLAVLLPWQLPPDFQRGKIHTTRCVAVHALDLETGELTLLSLRCWVQGRRPVRRIR